MGVGWGCGTHMQRCWIDVQLQRSESTAMCWPTAAAQLVQGSPGSCVACYPTHRTWHSSVTSANQRVFCTLSFTLSPVAVESPDPVTCYSSGSYVSGAIHRVIFGAGYEGPLPPNATIYYRVGEPRLGLQAGLQGGPEGQPYGCRWAEGGG